MQGAEEGLIVVYGAEVWFFWGLKLTIGFEITEEEVVFIGAELGMKKRSGQV